MNQTMNGSNGPASANRKKQKRRAKQPSSQPLDTPNGVSYEAVSTSSSDLQGSNSSEVPPAAQSHSLPESGHSSDPALSNGHTDQTHSSATSGKKSKKKKKGTAVSQGKSSKEDPIWDTSSVEERERIKQFWLSLNEDERKALVKIEKEAVLRKMKEQQKHTCSCTVCGRKRTAIEEELEVLYDAYYEELENYANHRNQLAGPSQNGSHPIPPAQSCHYHQHQHQPPPDPNPSHLTNSPQGNYHDQNHNSHQHQQQQRHHHQRHPHHHHNHTQSHLSHHHQCGAAHPYPPEADDPLEDPLEDDYPEDCEDDYLDDASLPPTEPGAQLFNFGNSLTVKGGILTVADDLLKNDGRKFIEMMEQLAERRMQREEEAQLVSSSLHHPSYHPGADGGHNSQLDEDDYEGEEEDDEFEDAQTDEYEEEDEADQMTDEQRMEEGRRMFQIFAARMFEQRVLSAYREQVARERQNRLIQEIEDEKAAERERDAKRAREAQKKKDRKQQQKLVKAQRDAEKAAEEAAQKAAEEKRLEEQRQQREEERKRKEAERKSQEMEKKKREAERIRKAQEEQERQKAAQRRAQEQKALEKKQREEARRKEQEEKEAKNRQLREAKRLQQEQEKEKEKERLQKAAAAKKASEVTMPVPPKPTTTATGPSAAQNPPSKPIPSAPKSQPQLSARPVTSSACPPQVQTTGNNAPKPKPVVQLLSKPAKHSSHPTPTPVVNSSRQVDAPKTPSNSDPAAQTSPNAAPLIQQPSQSSQKYTSSIYCSSNPATAWAWITTGTISDGV